MKNILYIIFTALSLGLHAQAVIADNATPAPTEPTAVLDVQSATRGMLVPRLSDAAMGTLASTATEGLIIFNTDDKCYYGFQQGDWYNLDGNCQEIKEGSFIFTGFQSFKGNEVGDGANPADKFSIVTLGPIPAGRVFYFTDNGWTENDEFTTNEGVLRWTVGNQTIPARTEILFYSPQNQSGGFEWTVSTNSATVSDVGMVSNVNSSGTGRSIQLTQNGDNILVFTATDDANPLNNVDKFLVAIKMETNWMTSPNSVTETNQSYIPTGLTNGETAIAIISTNDNLKIKCSEIPSGSSDDYIRGKANNYLNWESFTRDSSALPTGCSY